MEPFLKWAGGKRWLVPKIKDQIPQFKTYYEPFLGSGTLFFALEPRSAILSDVNPELINCYRQVKNNCGLVLKVLRRIKRDKASYYSIREKFNSDRDPVKRAAYFIYLNKMCWNGLYRVNGEGKFNVPIGKHTSSNYKIFDEWQLLNASKLLKRAKLLCCDFEETISNAKKQSDLVYLDPPYITTHMKNGFIKYNSVLFHQADELRLAKWAEKLTKRGVKVILSNAAHPLIKQQYDGVFYKTEIDRASLIAGDPTKRSRFLELLVTSFPIEVEVRERRKGKNRFVQIQNYRLNYNPKCRI